MDKLLEQWNDLHQNEVALILFILGVIFIPVLVYFWKKWIKSPITLMPSNKGGTNTQTTNGGIAVINKGSGQVSIGDTFQIGISQKQHEKELKRRKVEVREEIEEQVYPTDGDIARELWNIPFERNTIFTGRDDTLTEMNIKLSSDNSIALSGLGGVGKTQLAIEYAYKFKDQYSAVFWVNSDTQDAIFTSYLEIAKKLELPEAKQNNQDVVVDTVIHWLENETSWLLIHDNADNLALSSEFIPLSKTGHLILTTQATATGPKLPLIPIENMDLNNGILLLLRRSKMVSQETTLEEVSEYDYEKAELIYEKLGGLPLALDQAGAFMEETRSTLHEYYELYNIAGKKIREMRGEFNDHPNSVSVTFSLSFTKVINVNKTAADIIRFFSFLHPDRIPEELLKDGAPYLGRYLASELDNPLNLPLAIKDGA